MKEKIYDNVGIIIFKDNDKYTVLYDSGSHQITMREDFISEEEVKKIMADSSNATKILFDIQKKLQESGINP